MMDCVKNEGFCDTNEGFCTGICKSTPEILEDGRIRLHEKWQWTCGGGGAGESIVEEVKPS